MVFSLFNKLDTYVDTYFIVLLQTAIYPGVEFGARMVTIDGKQVKLQIWDTVSNLHLNIEVITLSTLKL